MAPAPTLPPAVQQDKVKVVSPEHIECIEVQGKDDEDFISGRPISRHDSTVSTVSVATEASTGPIARFYRSAKRLSRRLYRPFKPVDKWIQTRMRRSRFYGWRMGVLLGTCSSTFVLCCNIIAITVAMSRGFKVQGRILDIMTGAQDTSESWGYFDPSGPGAVVDIMSGGKNSVSQWSTVIHLIINVFSTILLAASNYTAQVLCSPTRADLDAAHQRGIWLDVGLLSLRNFRYLPRGRVILGLLLSASSIPLHLL